MLCLCVGFRSADLVDSEFIPLTWRVREGIIEDVLALRVGVLLLV